MPPSGYSERQASLIVEFLASCLDSLIAECEEARLDLPAGLAKEIADISVALADESRPPHETALLRLTRSFYETVAGAHADKAGVAVGRKDVLDAIRRDILAIHVTGQSAGGTLCQRP